jgi:hypothetical protein
MDATQKQIANLKKQNDGLEKSFLSKNISFTKLNIENVDPETELLLLTQYNDYLKNISKQNRPAPAPKPQPTPQPTPASLEEDEIEEPKPSFDVITSMEDMKRAFFSREYEVAFDLIKQHPLKFYKANYKYADDNTGRPSFIAKNLLRGFVQNLDDYRKYLMVCFRCILTDQEKGQYKYPSYWIVNTTAELKDMLGSLYDDFDFILVEDEERKNHLLHKMKKNENENDEAMIGEVYVH